MRRASTFDVVVAENMFGDILSDLAGELAGSLGIAPVDQRVGRPRAWRRRRTAPRPDIAGQGLANPIAMILSAGDAARLAGRAGTTTSAGRRRGAAGERRRAAAVRRGISTRDLGGTASTGEFTAAVVDDDQVGLR